MEMNKGKHSPIDFIEWLDEVAKIPTNKWDWLKLSLRIPLIYLAVVYLTTFIVFSLLAELHERGFPFGCIDRQMVERGRRRI